jgi:hypothetical protein
MEWKLVKMSIKEISNIIHGLWDSSTNVLSEFSLELMEQLEEAMLVQPRIDEVDKYRATGLDLIEKIEKVDREEI